MDKGQNCVWYMDRYSPGDKMCLIDIIPGEQHIDAHVYAEILGYTDKDSFNFIYWTRTNMESSGWTLVSKDEVKFHA